MVSLSTRGQGFTESQTELIQHWHDCRAGGQLPSRECLDPGAIRAHLASISLIEMNAAGQIKFRLAGSSLRKILGREMRGRMLSELGHDLSDMWSLGLASALEQGRPVGGVIERETDGHAWLRLPLASPHNGALILCHDALVSKSRLARSEKSESHKTSLGPHVLAA